MKGGLSLNRLHKNFIKSNITVESLSCDCSCWCDCTMCQCPDVMNYAALDGRYLTQSISKNIQGNGYTKGSAGR